MTNTKHTKKALLMSMLSMLICIAMLIGSTFAWFTDSVTSGRNQIVAGNLDVDLEHKVGDAFESAQDATLFNVELWEPGVMAYEQFKVVNKGSLALKYILSLVIDEKKVTYTKDGKTLADVIKIGVIDEATTETLPSTLTREALAEKIKDAGLLKDFDTSEGLYAPNGGKLEKDESTDAFTVVLYWEPGDNDNDYNLNNGAKAYEKDLTTEAGDALTIGFETRLYATQVESESDSFGNDYDKDAPLPTLSASGLATKLESLKKGEHANLQLGENMDVTGNGIELENGVDVTIDGDNKTVTVDHAAFNNYDGLEGINEGTLNFKNMTFKGANDKTLDGQFATVLGFDSEVEVVFENCHFVNLYAAVCANPTDEDKVSNIKFINCTFENVNYGVSIDPNTDPGTYTVTFEGCTGLTPDKYSEFNNGDMAVELAEDMNVTETGTVADRPSYGLDVAPGSDVTLDGAGKTVTLDHTAFNHFEGNEGITEGVLKFSNVNFTGKTKGAKEGYVTVLGFDSTADVVFENCTFTDMFSAVYILDGAKGTVTFKNCTFTNCAYACGMSDDMVSKKNTDGGITVTFENTKYQECGWKIKP